MKLTMEEFVPTEEEMEAAKRIVAAGSKKQLHAKMESMVGAIKRDPKMTEEQKKKVLDSRGDIRQGYLLKYCAYQAAKGAGTLATRATHSTSSASKTRYYYWNEFTLKKKVGADTAEAWIEIVDFRADPITGRSDEKLRQYIIPIEWYERTVADEEALTLSGSKAAGKDEVSNFESIAGVAAPKGLRPGSSKEPVVVKAEIKTPAELAEEELKEFKESASDRFNNIVGTVSSLQLLKTEALKDSMTANIADAAGGLVTQLTAAKKGLEKLMKANPSEKDADDKNIRKLMSTVNKLDIKVKNLEEWSKRLGVKINKGGASGSKRRRTE